MGRERAAFAPGRANLIGEHTDYNEGLALPFAIAEGITVHASTLAPVAGEEPLVRASAEDVGEEDEFQLADPGPATGWRAFVRGAVAELGAAGFPLQPVRLRIAGDLPAGAGLSSSAAVEVALCLALIAVGSPEEHPLENLDRVALARLCQRVESDWVGARTGLLDQLASLFGCADAALLIDFRALSVERVPMRMAGWRLVVLDSGETHSLADSGYNERRAECARACELLGVRSLRDAREHAVLGLPEPYRSRAAHVVGENRRVLEAAEALRHDEWAALAVLLNAAHASLRDLYEVSTPLVETAVTRLRDTGAAAARIVGGGFGGSVLGLLEPGVAIPAGAREVRPGPGAHLLCA